MKTSSLLVVSLLLNAGLGFATFQTWKGRTPPSLPAIAPAPAAAVVKKEVAPKKLPSATPTHPFSWQNIESADYRDYIANLRAIGCPEETIEDIIVADINQLFAERSVKKAKTEFKFWDTRNPFGAFFDAESMDKNEALEEEKQRLLKELLGRDVLGRPNLFSFLGVNPLESMLGFLPSEKQVKVLELQQSRAGKQGVDPLNNKELQVELAKILTPEELKEYNLRLSPTSMQMRMELSAFEPSREEFEKIFAAKEKSTSADNSDKEKLNAELKQSLGEERFAQYVRAQDPTYRALVGLADRQKLDRAVAGQVQDIQKAYLEQQKQLASLPPDRQVAALEAMQRESRAELKRILGEKAFNSFQRNPMVSSWLPRQPSP